MKKSYNKKKFNKFRYRTNDFELIRDADVELRLTVDVEYHASYLHTHRYFFAFLDFWMNFAELQDRVFKQNMPSMAKVKYLICLNKGVTTWKVYNFYSLYWL